MSRTWDEDEIREAVMSYEDGCTSGKIAFLDKAFSIDANCEQTIKITVSIKLDTYNEHGSEIGGDDIAWAVESLLDSELSGRLECENIDSSAACDYA